MGEVVEEQDLRERLIITQSTVASLHLPCRGGGGGIRPVRAGAGGVGRREGGGALLVCVSGLSVESVSSVVGNSGE